MTDNTSTTSAKARTEKVLRKVEALMAKAESTEFDEEAQALIAKAESLMTEHQITEAMLRPAQSGPPPIVRKLYSGIPNTWMKERQHLYCAIAEANDMYAVYTPRGGCIHAFGTAAQHETLGALAPSLDRQMMAAMEAEPYPPGRGPVFRRSFLNGFTWTIKARLKEGRADALDGTDHSTALVLASTAQRAAAEANDQMNINHTRSQLTTDLGGISAGRRAGESATLGRGSIER